MKTKEFTLLQLFPIVDGRLADSMNDVYDVLGFLCGDESISTIGLTMVADRLDSLEPKPQWWYDAKADIDTIIDNLKENYDFDDIITDVRKIKTKYELEPLNLVYK